MTERIIALIDMDCFYCQVEARINPTLKGKPMAVVQYNAWQGGGIIAVNYEARDFGVTRHLRGKEAKQKCPDIALVQVPELRGKADLTKYRAAGQEVVSVLSQFSDCVERASIDEAYVDLTLTVDNYVQKMEERVAHDQLPNTFIVGFSEDGNNYEEFRLKGLKSWLAEQMVDTNDLRLAVGGIIVEEVRAAIYKQTEFRCSAGIAHNKVLAKLVCGLHKPNRQTILPHNAVTDLYRTLSIKKVRHLGGKLGDTIMEKLGCKVMLDLQQFTEAQLQQHFDIKNGSWLYNISRGIDYEPVTSRLTAKSIGCCKNFPGKQALVSRTSVEKWLMDLANEMVERLVKDQEENKRRAKLLVVSFLLDDTSSSRSTNFISYDANRIMEDASEIIKKANGDKWSTPIKFLGLSAGKFTDICSDKNSIQNFFKSVDKEPHVGDQKKDFVDDKIDPADTNSHVKENTISHEKKGKQKKNDGGSFFTNYFTKQNVSNATEDGDNSSSILMPTCSKNTSSAPSYSDKSDLQNDPNNSNSDQPALATSNLFDKFATNSMSDDSNSSDDKMLISPSEIFPDLYNIDESVASLLPASMRDKILARRKDKLPNCVDAVPQERANSPLYEDAGQNVEDVQEDSTEVSSSEARSTVPGNCKRNLCSENESDNTVVDEDRIHCTQRAPVRLPAEKRSETRGESNKDKEFAQIPTKDNSDIPGQRCDKCLKYIPLFEYLEHVDFHAAKELDQQLNSVQTIPMSSVNKPHSSTKTSSPTKSNALVRKRGRPSKNSIRANTSDKKLRSITSFFTSSSK